MRAAAVLYYAAAFGLGVALELGLSSETPVKSHGGIRTPGALPSDYQPAPLPPAEPSAWGTTAMAALRRCLNEGRVGSFVQNPCRWSCEDAIPVVDGGAQAVLEAWSQILPQEACDAQEDEQRYRP